MYDLRTLQLARTLETTEPVTSIEVSSCVGRHGHHYPPPPVWGGGEGEGCNCLYKVFGGGGAC